MAQQIRDLDLIDPEPISVRLKGTVYQLPGDVPAPLYLRLLQIGQQAADGNVDSGTLEELYDRLLGLFQEHQPDLDELPIGLRQMISAVTVIYAGGDAVDDDEPEEGAPPARPTRPTRTPARRPSRSASSKS